jgi:hypothetical protein
MTKGVSARQQHEDRLRLRRKQRDEVASALALGSAKPVPAVRVPTAPKRLPVGAPTVAARAAPGPKHPCLRLDSKGNPQENRRRGYSLAC